MGAVMRAQCLITGAEPADQPLPLARQLARQAVEKGVPAAGFELYRAFLADPQYRYFDAQGRPDMSRYNALAALPLAQRTDQIEAYNGLGTALGAGNGPAVLSVLSYLTQTTAPGNLERTINLAASAQRANLQLPQFLLADVQLAQQIKRLGGSQASVRTFKDAYRSALMAAVGQIRGGKSEGACDAKDIRIARVENIEPVLDAAYLPLNRPLANTYLMQGTWSESWVFAGCDQTAIVKMTFKADGWGGAFFSTSGVKPS